MNPHRDQIIRRQTAVAELGQLADVVRRDAVYAERDVLIEVLLVAERLHLADESGRDIVHREREEIALVDARVGRDAEGLQSRQVGAVRAERETADALAVLERA